MKSIILLFVACVFVSACEAECEIGEQTCEGESYILECVDGSPRPHWALKEDCCYS